LAHVGADAKLTQGRRLKIDTPAWGTPKRRTICRWRRKRWRSGGKTHLAIALRYLATQKGYTTESQETRGTIGSQLAALRERVATEGQELIAEFCDDGYSGARLDRPGLDALRDAAEAGVIEAVWCLSPDRLARLYAYQGIVLDELNRHGVGVLFTDAPALDDDPQARLLVQVQGVIAE
jgi:hypothetical protein